MSPISLLELSQLIRYTLERHLEQTYWVIAEIGELRQHHRGHCYLELIDKKGDELATKQRATIWSYSYRTISQHFEQVTGQPLGPGLKILCQVQVQYHELYGMSLNILKVDPNYTMGERARRRAEIVQRLIAEGIYDLNRRHSLPLVPQRIAVISSPTAAGWGDFADQLIRNPYRFRFDVVLFQASMQGDGAGDSICLALEQIARAATPFDAVVIIRGGGARTDLDCFDQYELAVSIAQFELPIVTGIGHERDETIADLVAHTRLKTPTAVAEFLISGLRSYEEQLEALANRLFGYADQYLNRQEHQLSRLQQHLQAGARGLLTAELKHLQQLGAGLGTNTRYRLRFDKERLRNLQKTLYSVSDRALCNEASRLDQLAITLHLQDPKRLLRRGYTITYLEGKPLHKAGAPQPGQLLITHTSSKIVTSKVENTTSESDE
ncbi:exodeoxyribonuclease VII large subunit [Cesiribacter andamanensis]|uniref:Exodeoxyribonuclease 7 large subunit n=1 Tax=Cesiribacter andamanensis AMV16 TaxID=1279009 RepID=M7MXH3_9BACT|nr:exodeoxyribonuclease VII large subunit [Cesiribacter andamanensis]EMR01143.1 Exodeoxyribonuclease 7 large subunit [Cesiribacter andamanensis AMV16]